MTFCSSVRCAALTWPSCITFLLTPGVEPVSNSAALLGSHNQSHQASSGLMEESSAPQHQETNFGLDSSTASHLPQKARVPDSMASLSKEIPSSVSSHQVPPYPPFCVLNLTETKSRRPFPLYICTWKGTPFHSHLLSVRLAPQEILRLKESNSNILLSFLYFWLEVSHNV